MEYKTLKDIAKITMGQSPDSSSYNKEKDGLPFFQGNADFGELYPNERLWCNEPKKVAMPGDILISVRAPIGALNYAKDKSCIGRGLAAITIKNIVERNYIFHFLKARNNYLNSKGTGSTFKAIGKNVLEEVLVPQISREEQQKCVNMIDLLGSIMRERQSQIDKLDELVKARFVEMFGLPVSNTKKWFTEKMSDVAPSINYTGKFNDKIWLLNLDMIEAQTGEIIGYLFVNEDEVGSSTCSFDTSNVLYSKLRPYLNKVVIPNRCGYATSELVPLQPAKGKLNREYLAFMLRSDEFVNMINEKVIGAKMPRVSMSEFRKFDVPIPPIELQNQFAAFVYQVNKSKFDYLLIISNPYIQNPNFAVKWS